MKEFRGTLLAFLVLAVVAGVYVFVSGERHTETEQEKVLFRFEKHDVQAVEIIQSNGTNIQLQEKDGIWFVQAQGWRADPSMINRIKHQLHDLDARTKVTLQADEPTRYGLGENATRVSLLLDDGRKVAFLVGDPSPSAVSYYIQPLPGEVVYTVKKSAMDYFTHDITAFRDPRFARFDIKDAQEIALVSPQQQLFFRKTGIDKWILDTPSLDVDYTEIRQILSKMASLKALRFIDAPEGVLDYGFSHPQLRMKVVLPEEEKTILVGSSFTEGQSELSYIQLEGEKTIYVARFPIADLLSLTSARLRNKKICNVQDTEIISIEGEVLQGGQVGVGKIDFRAGVWSWSDGSLVSGSTPKRLASAIADLRVLSFAPPNAIREPYARIRFVTEEAEKELWIGGVAEERKDEEGNLFLHYYAWMGADTYLIDGHVWHVLTDLIREQTRKNEEDAKTKELHERMEQ